jgi:hypothetical protein
MTQTGASADSDLQFSISIPLAVVLKEYMSALTAYQR